MMRLLKTNKEGFFNSLLAFLKAILGFAHVLTLCRCYMLKVFSHGGMKNQERSADDNVNKKIKKINSVIWQKIRNKRIQKPYQSTIGPHALVGLTSYIYKEFYTIIFISILRGTFRQDVGELALVSC